MVQYIVKAKESPIPQWRIIELQGQEKKLTFV